MLRFALATLVAACLLLLAVFLAVPPDLLSAARAAAGSRRVPAAAPPGRNAAPPRPAAVLLVSEHEMLRVQVDGAPHDLETLIVRPDGAGPWPIALITHGVPGSRAELRRLSPRTQERLARDLARRGWAAAAVMRRGFGASSGEYGGLKGCANPDYDAVAAAYAADLAGVLDALRRRRWADARAKAVVMGESGGAFTALALAAARPRDIGAAFASNPGGGGRPGTGEICDEARFSATVRRLGGAARGVPTLWITGDDDPLFPALKQAEWQRDWEGGGGMAETVLVPAGQGYQGNGHWLLYSPAAAVFWLPAMDRLLRGADLSTWDTASARAALGAVGGAAWPATTRAAYAQYLAGQFTEKAFAATPDGRVWGYAGALRTTAEAEQWALRRCGERRPAGAPACALVAVNWGAPPH